MHKCNSTLNTLSSITSQNPCLPLPLLFYVILVLKEVFMERGAKPFGLQRRKRMCWSPKPGPKMITLTFYKRKEVYLGEQMLPKQLKLILLCNFNCLFEP